MTLSCKWVEPLRTRLRDGPTVDATRNATRSARTTFEPTLNFSLNIFSIWVKTQSKASGAARFFFSVSCQTFGRPGAAIWLFVEMPSNSTLGALLNWFHLSATRGLTSDLPATPPKICPPPSPAKHTHRHTHPPIYSQWS